jgi:hypothetical protein
MADRKNILILADDEYRSIAYEAPLKLAGYRVYCRKSIEEAFNLCLLGDELEQPIDLLIVDGGLGSRSLLEEFRRTLGARYLMLVGDTPDCPEMYCTRDRVACLCNPSALLAASRELFFPGGQTNKKMTKPHCGAEQVKHSDGAGLPLGPMAGLFV